MFQLACCEEWGLDDDDVHVVTSYYYKGKVTGCYFKYKVSHWDWSPGTTATSEQELGYLDNVANTGCGRENVKLINFLTEVLCGGWCRWWQGGTATNHRCVVNMLSMSMSDHWTLVTTGHRCLVTVNNRQPQHNHGFSLGYWQLLQLWLQWYRPAGCGSVQYKLPIFGCIHNHNSKGWYIFLELFSVKKSLPTGCFLLKIKQIWAIVRNWIYVNKIHFILLLYSAPSPNNACCDDNCCTRSKSKIWCPWFYWNKWRNVERGVYQILSGCNLPYPNKGQWIFAFR